MKRQAVVINIRDNVATVVEDLSTGTSVSFLVAGVEQIIELKENIPIGHKFAIKDISQGSDIIKYGESIGVASSLISPGQHVHVHNMDSQRGRGDLNK